MAEAEMTEAETTKQTLLNYLVKLQTGPERIVPAKHLRRLAKAYAATASKEIKIPTGLGYIVAGRTCPGCGGLLFTLTGAGKPALPCEIYLCCFCIQKLLFAYRGIDRNSRREQLDTWRPEKARVEDD